MKKLFIIGASILQLPAILKAKEMGLYVGVADYNPNAVGISYADEYFNVSTIDEEGIYEAAKRFKADGIMTLATDMPMRALAYACEKMNLIGIEYKTALKSTDKLEMIKSFEKFEVAHPWFYSIKDEDDLEQIKEKVKYPCITKPTDNSGSRGVMVVNSFEELKKAASYSFANSRSKKIIIEEMLCGNEISVEIIVYKGVVNIIQITDKLTTGAPHFVEKGHSQPSRLEKNTIEKVKKLATKAVEAVGIKNGPAHVEIMVTKDGPKMIELGARLGGDCITTHLVPLSTGVDMVKETINICLGEKPNLESKYQKASAIRFILGEKGIIQEISGQEKAYEIPGIKDVDFMKQLGDEIKEIESSNDRIGYVISQQEDVESAIKSVEEALEKIEVKIKKKKILFLGGFPQMIDIIKTAGNMGIYTVVVDRDSNSPAKKIADKSYNVSTDKINDLVQICREEKIDGIFNGFEDFNIHVAEKLCKILSLSFYSNKKQLEMVTNKNSFKNLCKKNSIEIIEQYDLENAIKENKYPYIVKPVDSYGSRGIFICFNEEELRKGYLNAVESSFSKKAIIERFIDSNIGTEFFYTIVNGNIHLTATADRYTVKLEKNTVPLPVAEVFPSKIQKNKKLEMDKKLKRLIKDLEIKNGLVLIQAINDKENIYPYEMAYRFTGEQHYQLVKEQKGINLAEMMIKYCLNENIEGYDNDLINDDNFIKPAANIAILLNPGKINKIDGIEKLKNISEIKSYIVTHSENDVIETKVDYSRILLRANIVADNYEELLEVIDKIQKSISVVSDLNKNMINNSFSLIQ